MIEKHSADSVFNVIWTCPPGRIRDKMEGDYLLRLVINRKKSEKVLFRLNDSTGNIGNFLTFLEASVSQQKVSVQKLDDSPLPSSVLYLLNELNINGSSQGCTGGYGYGYRCVYTYGSKKNSSSTHNYHDIKKASVSRLQIALGYINGHAFLLKLLCIVVSQTVCIRN
ncbi:hypothetical protein L6452_29437 [Arctium lappa]|uniref:Uncharacterized protein n=1 Tax=Arctium lappa TaxID=4217 RepID=A0ACB8ZGV4_ARCLA|nr:hypothetical protein L6452_29437 [Arctium lappa]